MKIAPSSVPARSFHSVSASVPVLVLFVCQRTKPPELKKYLAAAALAQVTVCVNVMVHAVVPEPVAVVLEVVPENIPYSVPLAAALRRLV